MENLQLIVSLIEGTNDLIYSTTKDGNFEFVNRSWLETLGYSTQEADELNITDILFPGHLKQHQEITESILSGEYLTDIEMTFLTKDMERVYVKGNIFPRQENGKIIGITGFFRDITDKKQTEKQLEDARIRAEFLVDLMVHDLTNINQEILSVFDVLLFDSAMPNHLESLIKEGVHEIERSSRLISNVRKISRLYAATPQQKTYDLHSAIQEIKPAIEREFPDKKLNLDVRIPPNNYFVEADEYFDDVLFSLLHNSMKFGDSTDVKVEIDAEEIEHTPFLRVQIRDYGPGIPDADKETVFSRLSHEKDSILGVGLGLTLVKKIIENYGGYIRVEDRVDGDYTKGTNFVILIRQAPKQQFSSQEVEA